MIVPRIDRDHHRQARIGGEEGSGKRGQRGKPDDRFPGGKRETARRRDADA